VRETLDRERIPGHLFYQAHDALLGREPESLRRGIELRRRITAAEVSAALESALGTTLLMLPQGARLPAGRFSEYPLQPPELPAGRAFGPREPDESNAEDRLVVGPDGVALRGP